MHVIKYSIIRKVKNFSILFWPLAFPLILATLFYFAFGKISAAGFETIPAAVVEEKGGDPFFHTFMDQVGEDGQFLKTETMTEEEALQALEERTVTGIFYAGETPFLKVADSGMSESILQSLLESYLNGKHTLEAVAETHPENLPKAVAAMSDYRETVEELSLGGKSMDSMAVFFYALVAMACLYGCFVGFGSAMWIQANQTSLAARQCVSPVHRLTTVLTELLTSFGLHFLNVVILLVYLKYILHMEFGGNFPQMLLVSLIGSVTGVSMGLLVGSAGKLREGVKIAILIGISMTAAVLAGLVNNAVKFMVDQKFPLLNKINPAARIADAFYCINIYDDPVRFREDLIVLIILCAGMTAASFLVVRRERYDSI